MSKKLSDLVLILIQIEESLSKMYKNIASINGQYSLQIRTAASILANQELIHAEKYQMMLLRKEIESIEISDKLFDTSRNLLREFKKKVQLSNVSAIKELVEIGIYYEKENAIVLNTILEHIEESDQIFKALILELIEAEVSHSKTLESFIKN